MADVRIDYHTGAEGSVESLKLWACCKEYRSLICDWSPDFSWSDGPRFANGYHSRKLGRLLQAILMNQNLFGPDCGPRANGTLDIGIPTSEDITHGTVQVSEAFNGAGSWKDIVRQQWNFSPPNTIEEFEEYKVELSSAAALELSVNPDISMGVARASLHRLQVAVRSETSSAQASG